VAEEDVTQLPPANRSNLNGPCVVSAAEVGALSAYARGAVCVSSVQGASRASLCGVPPGRHAMSGRHAILRRPDAKQRNRAPATNFGAQIGGRHGRDVCASSPGAREAALAVGVR